MTKKRTISFLAAVYLSFGVNGSIVIQDSFENEIDGMVVLNAIVVENLINVPEAILISMLGLAMIGFGFYRRNKRAVNQNGSYRRRFGA